jgi:UrcA family protein
MNRTRQYVLRTEVTGVAGVFLMAGLSIAGVFFMGGVSTALAATPSSNAGNTISANTSLADLDLAKSADVAIARARINRLAHRLCNRFEDSLSLSHQADYVACLADAIAKAEPRLQRLAAEQTSKVHLAGLQR